MQLLKILEESGGQAEDVTEQVQKRLQEPCSSKEVDGPKINHSQPIHSPINSSVKAAFTVQSTTLSKV
jgi:hypothetical protein